MTWHGFALNVMTNLSYFDLIVPCGIQGVEMTSVAKELPLRGEAVPDDLSVDSAGELVSSAFAEVFDLVPVDISTGEVQFATPGS